jgi:hypothetical protein
MREAGKLLKILERQIEHHSAVANITERSLRRCHGEFLAPLPVWRENNILFAKNFSAPLATDSKLFIAPLSTAVCCR